MEEKKEINKTDMLLVTFLYIIVIAIIILLIFSLKNQKKVVRENLNNSIEERYE